MSDQYNKIREIDDIETVRGKYRNAFQNFFTTGFDIIFQKEFLDKISDEKGTSQKENESDHLNLSVTDEDLQKLDDANSRNAFYRKVYPAKCSLLLERALKVQLEATSKLKTNVHTIEPIENNTESPIDPEFENSILELNQQSGSLLANIKENTDRLRRLEAAQKILLNNKI